MIPSWFVRVPAGLFAIPFGLFGLAGAWRKAAQFGWPAAATAGTVLLWLATGIWILLLLIFTIKCLRFRQIVLRDAAHPLSGSALALLPLSTLLAAIQWGHSGSVFWLTLALAAIALLGALAVRILFVLAAGQLTRAMISPLLYLPVVGFGFVGGMTLAALEVRGWGPLLYGMGLAGWGLLEFRILNVLFEGPMAEGLRPGIGAELAPPAVATLSAAAIWPGLPADVLLLGLGLAAAFVGTVLARYRWWTGIPFSAGFWSFSFPLAAMAGALVETVKRGGWPADFAAAGLLCVSTVFAILAIKTLGLIGRGRLLPPA